MDVVEEKSLLPKQEQAAYEDEQYRIHRDLWSAVILRAIRDAQGMVSPSTEEIGEVLQCSAGAEQRLTPLERLLAVDFAIFCMADEALEWLMDKSEEEGSFVWICRHLDLDPECVRSAACKLSI